MKILNFLHMYLPNRSVFISLIFKKTALDIIHLFIHLYFRCPDITRLYTLSEPSVNGIPLYVLEFTDNPGKHELCKYYATITK